MPELATAPGARTTRASWRIIAAGATLIVGLTVFAGWVAWRWADRPATWQVVRYQGQDPANTWATFQVTRPPGSTATCILHASNNRMEVVGIATATLAASPEPTTQHTVTITASEPAVAVTIAGCTITPHK